MKLRTLADPFRPKSTLTAERVGALESLVEGGPFIRTRPKGVRGTDLKRAQRNRSRIGWLLRRKN